MCFIDSYHLSRRHDRRTADIRQGDNDFRAQLIALKSTNPEVLFVPGHYKDVVQIAVQARDLGITQPLVGGDGWESPRLLELGGKSLEGCFHSNHYDVEDPEPAVREFVRKYAVAALGYDALQLRKIIDPPEQHAEQVAHVR